MAEWCSYKDRGGGNMSSVPVLMSMVAENNLDINNYLQKIVNEFEVTGLHDIKAQEVVHVASNKVFNSKALGNIQNFNSVRVDSISITKLTDKRIIIAYRRTYPSSYTGNIIVGDIVDENIEFGPNYTFESTSLYGNISVVAVSNSRVLIKYQIGSSYACKIIVGDINSNKTIEFGLAYFFNGENRSYNNSIVVLTESKFGILYVNNNPDADNSYGKIKIANILCDQSINFSSEMVFESSDVGHISATKLSQNEIAVIHNRGKYIYSNVIKINNNSSIEIGKKSHFHIGDRTLFKIKICVLSNNKFIFLYSHSYNYGSYLCIGEIKDNQSIVYGSAVRVTISHYTDVTILNDNRVALNYCKNSNSTSGYVEYFTISDDNNLVSDSKYEYLTNEQTLNYCSIVSVTNSKVVIAFNHNNGQALIAESVKPDAKDIGIALEDALIGETARILMSGSSNEFKEVNCGDKYVGLERTVGHGISKNSIIVKPFWEVD